MRIYRSLDALPRDKLALTIGTFDGVHKGHQALLKKLISYQAPTAVLTFSSHPLELLRPPAPHCITPLPIKISLFEALGIENMIILPFSAIVNIPFDEFLNRLPLSHLLLGKPSAFGKGRLGTEENVRNWAVDKPIHVEYIDEIDEISSTQIRAAIKSGDQTLVEQLLGHNHYERYTGV